jgi:hypothetical protein
MDSIKTQKLRRITIIIIALTVLVLGLYDIYAYVEGGGEATISVVIWENAKDWPMIPFLAGVLCGHFFWQNETVVVRYVDKQQG